jgi:lipoprotein-anchoring transpeptidase ErfK/SrfK
MERKLKQWLLTGLGALSLALFATITPVFAATPQSQAQPHIQAQPQTTYPYHATVTDSANVRGGPTLHAHIYSVDSPGTAVTVYAQVTGDTVWAGNLWDRITSSTTNARYIYAALVQANSSGSGGNPPTTSAKGKLILVSISKQWLWAYQDGKEVFNTAVTTAQPGLVTPLGTYHIFSHLHPTTFYSPWPPGSPYWYPPTHINYAMGWHVGGFFIHDSYWRSVYGPGTNVWHHDPVDGWETGTHGCITAALKAVIWLYYWAPNGTTVQVVR